MITSIYAGLLVFVYLILTALVIRRRLSLRISLGDGGDKVILRYIRAHANFVETVPFALFLIFLIDYQDGAPFIIHALGIMLLLGRILHPYAIITHQDSAGKVRTIGMVLTLLSILFAGSLNICLGLAAFL